MLVSNHELRQITEQPPVTLITQKRRLMLFRHLARMDESVGTRRILIAVPQSDWKRFTGRPGWPLWRMICHLTISVKMQLTWHWTVRFRGYWQQALKWCKLNNDDDTKKLTNLHHCFPITYFLSYFFNHIFLIFLIFVTQLRSGSCFHNKD